MKIGYKRCGNTIVKLELLGETNEDRSVTDPNFAKYRCSQVRVLEHIKSPVGCPSNEVCSDSAFTTISYPIGIVITVPDYDKDHNIICGKGIHYFKSLSGAENYHAMIHNKSWYTFTGQRMIFNDNGKFRGTLHLVNGKFHREDKPAIEWSNGDKEWFFHGKLHRTDGPAIERCNGIIKNWYYHGKLHRADGPAIEVGIDKKWFFDGIPYKRIKRKKKITRKYKKTII